MSTAIRRALSFAVPTALVVAAVAAVPASASPIASSQINTTSTISGPTTQGIIMSDGRICNPRWGC